jgi:tetratricopeptide (TPR) repeat protein
LALAEDDCSKDHRQICPAAARVHAALGVLEELRNRKKQAANEYLLSLKADPRQVEAKHDLALLWSRSNKNVAKAEQMWQEILESSPEYVPTLIAYSEYLRSTNRLEQALPLYESVIRLRPDYVPAIIGLAELRTRMGGAAIALSILEQNRKIAGLNPDYWLARARAHVARSELADARSDYAEALRVAGTRARKDDIRRESANRFPAAIEGLESSSGPEKDHVRK